ncbi:hypothetical protein [Streptomyces tateyamensis]|uniref:hypothetical protein n=1 Tax=Streptomyces tateyamensis TaxID=565073 RepID=UPI0015E88B93|nr:hypothetical protein [Streptomyces tateyamensis]
MSKSAVAFIFVGLFLAGGVFSFWKQKVSRGVIAVLAVGSVMCLSAGIMRL